MATPPPPTDRSMDDLVDFGVVVVDKPEGPTSHQVGAWVADIVGADRAGHMGTLDPGVTGCLPILLGRATRLTEVLSAGEKEYVAILELHGDPPTDWRDRIDEFHGEIYQKPPRKSAVARRIRTRTISDLSVVQREDRRLLLQISCEAGTYIRKLCHDIGLVMGTGGHMAELRRTASEPFDDTDVVTLHDLTDGVAFYDETGDRQEISALIRPAEDAISHLPTVTISPGTAEAVADGAPVYAPGVIEVDDALESIDDQPLVVCVVPAGSAVCIGTLLDHPDRTDGIVVELERVLV